MSTPSIKVGQGNWGIKATSLLGYANMDKKFVAREFTVGRLLDTATRVNASGTIEGVNANIPRIDYFGGQASLLVEPSVTNGLLNSADTTTGWGVGTRLTSNAIDVIGVSGTNLTVAVSGSGINSTAGRTSRSDNNVALASGSTYTISFFVKKTGTHTIGGYYALITGAAAGNLAGGFNVSGSFSSGLIYDTAGTTNRIRRVEQWGTDVFRCSETFTMTASGTLTSFSLAPLAGVTSENNPTVGSQIGFAAPQIELGSAPTSFIPTTTGTVTRNADVISVTGVAGLIGQTEGTIYAEFSVDFNNRNADILSLNAGNSNNGFFMSLRDTSVVQLIVRTLGNNELIFQRVGAFSIGVNKLAMAYKNGDFAICLNGTAVQTNTNNITMPSVSINKVGLGDSALYALDRQLRIRAASIYQTRLPNTTTDGSPSLQSITTP